MVSSPGYQSYICLYTVPSDSPFNVTLTALSSYALNITWQPPPAGTQNGVIRYYIVNITNFEMATLINTHDDATLLTVDNLHPYYLYTISVAAVSVGVGPFSFTKTILMPEAGKRACTVHGCSLINFINYTHKV